MREIRYENLEALKFWIENGEPMENKAMIACDMIPKSQGFLFSYENVQDMA